MIGDICSWITLDRPNLTQNSTQPTHFATSREVYMLYKDNPLMKSQTLPFHHGAKLIMNNFSLNQVAF